MQFISQDICESGSVTALSGMALHSHEPRLALLALDRLVPLVDSCSGSDFINRLARFVRILGFVNIRLIISPTKCIISPTKCIMYDIMSECIHWQWNAR